MTVRLRLTAMLLALVLGALASVLAACGSDQKGLISATRAERLQDDLDVIAEAVAAGRCDAVDGRLQSLRKEVQALPGTVDPDLRRALRAGVSKLEQTAPTECAGATTTETAPQTTETAPPQTTETTPPATTETTPPATTETAPTPTTPPAETTPPADTTPVTPSAPGGEQAPGAVIG